jgi:hypothetical protein
VFVACRVEVRLGLTAIFDSGADESLEESGKVRFRLDDFDRELLKQHAPPFRFVQERWEVR